MGKPSYSSILKELHILKAQFSDWCIHTVNAVKDDMSGIRDKLKTSMHQPKNLTSTLVETTCQNISVAGRLKKITENTYDPRKYARESGIDEDMHEF